jgi:hypothetical protein
MKRIITTVCGENHRTEEIKEIEIIIHTKIIKMKTMLTCRPMFRMQLNGAIITRAEIIVNAKTELLL